MKVSILNKSHKPTQYVYVSFASDELTQLDLTGDERFKISLKGHQLVLSIDPQGNKLCVSHERWTLNTSSASIHGWRNSIPNVNAQTSPFHKTVSGDIVVDLPSTPLTPAVVNTTPSVEEIKSAFNRVKEIANEAGYDVKPLQITLRTPTIITLD